VTTAPYTEQTVERPTLSLVPDPPAVVEGTVVEHQSKTVRPAWIESQTARLEAAKRHALGNRLYVPWVPRGYLNLTRAWIDGWRDDYPQMIRSARAALKASNGNVDAETKLKATVTQRRKDYLKHRAIFTGKTAVWGGAATGIGTVGTALGGLWVDIALGLAAYATGAWNGRDRTAADRSPIPGLPASDIPLGRGAITIEDLPEGAVPFPISQAQTEEQAAMCVLLGLLAEGVPAAEVSDVVRQQWGWQCIVRVSEGTPEAIIKVAGDLETRFDLPTNGVRPQPMIERRACAVLRLVAGNPFATAPGLPYRAPKSMSITDKFRVGTSVGGDPLDICLAGVMGLWVAASGGGKTGILQALAEATTACHDNITIDLDPHGDGLEDLYDGVRITARTHEQIEAVLLFFLVMSKARARLRKKLGMGKKWIPSAQHPAVTIFFDEFPKATDLAKRLAFDLLLVGRKELIDLEIASQGGTKLYLGENIAQMIAMKGVGPCKVGDTRAVFGDGAVSEGWLPHRLSPATDTDPKDAGHIYIQGVPGRPDEPIEYAIHEAPSATLKKLAAERLAAGLVDPDLDSLEAMAHVDLPEYVEAEYDNDGNLKKEAPVSLLSWGQLLRLCDAAPAEIAVAVSPAEVAAADAVDVMRRFGVDRMRTETLVAALAELAPGAYADLTAEQLKALLKEAGAGSPVQLGALDGEKNPRGYKLETLTSLA
jgi:S-DNA-T family DNA segregation ATPase FtsK/SpoIIIE